MRTLFGFREFMNVVICCAKNISQFSGGIMLIIKMCSDFRKRGLIASLSESRLTFGFEKKRNAEEMNDDGLVLRNRRRGLGLPLRALENIFSLTIVVGSLHIDAFP